MHEHQIREFDKEVRRAAQNLIEASDEFVLGKPQFDAREYVRNLILQWHCVEGAPCILNPPMLKVVHRGSSWAVGTWDG